MLGIIHHSPVVVSVIFDRNRFRKQFISFDEIQAGVWDTKVDEFLQVRDSSRRVRVLFIDRLDGLKLMVDGGFDPDPFRIVVFDDESLLGSPVINVVDAQLDGDTWKLYRLLPERFNDALAEDEPGLPSGWDVIVAPEGDDDEDPPPPTVVKGKSATGEMEAADSIMSSILNADSKIEDDGDDDLGPEEDESEADEPNPDPLPDEDEPETPKVDNKPTKKKAKKAKKAKKSKSETEEESKPKVKSTKKLQSHRLF